MFAEKPGAETATEARSIADAADAAGVIAMVAYMKRFGTAFSRARELIHSPEFGPLTIASFKWAMGSVVGEHDSLESWLFENPIHHIDLARYYCGELDSWQAQLARNSGDDYAVAVTARTPGGGRREHAALDDRQLGAAQRARRAAGRRGERRGRQRRHVHQSNR